MMKVQADKKRIHMEFDVGDLVLVKLQPYRQMTVANRGNNKLSLKYFGPFPIEARIGSVAYKVTLPATAKIHPVLHISQLKQFKGNSAEPYFPLSPTTSEFGPIMLPDYVIKTRTILKGPLSVPQVLVKWQNMDTNLATWEDHADMLVNFPNFNLEVKVAANGESIVRNDQSLMRENDEPTNT
ncbi:hypothetical protein A2U01_0043159, partial [Trifolium medium]|nr:hypothetical protein [Trifolium medium]